jgi:beta-galactosidase GanA
MKPNSLLVFFCMLISFANGQDAQANIPHLSYMKGHAELLVDGRPFLMRAGELGNSSASDRAYMKPIWPKLLKMHLNTLLAPVYWELLEPHEGKFDFSLVDGLVADARRHGLKLVFLWFGTWKNSMSCYVPAWIKMNQERFARVAGSTGRSEEIITPFSKNALLADKKAFTALMRHIREVDGRLHTVLMIQVENEIGMLPEARDHSQLADTAFNAPVPARLIKYLGMHRNTLVPEIKKIWEDGGSKTSGTWEEVFGKSAATDELFMAWYFGMYVDEIARAGKAVYAIPMYVNAALNAPGKAPGQYPSAGPLPHVMDIWKAAAPTIDFLAPDFYNPNFRYWNDRYSRSDNILFIPEHRLEAGVEAKALYAFGHYHAIGFSPFSIESSIKPEDEPIGKSYALIQQLTEEIGKAPENGRVDAVLLSKEADSCRLEMGDFVLTVAHDLALGWSPKAKDDKWPLTAGIIICISNDEFYVGGTGVVITFQPRANGQRAGILCVEEGHFLNGKWQPERRMNGDQDHQGRHLRIAEGEYGIQRIKLYTYN